MTWSEFVCYICVRLLCGSSVGSIRGLVALAYCV